MNTSFKDQYYWTVKEDIRKHHYYRGMRAALLITVPVIAFLSICTYILVMAA